MMQKYLNKEVLFLLACTALSWTMTAQSIITEKEKEVKISGKYLWSHATDVEEGKAKDKALTMLFESDDFKNQLKNNPNLNKSGISYLVRSRGDQLMAIAYIDKNETGTVPVYLTDKNVPVNTVAAPVVVPTAKSSLQESKKPIADTYPILTSTSKTINILLKIKDSENLINTLIDLKNQGKLIYSAKEGSFDKISDCYVVLYDKNTSRLTHILGKGFETRINFLNSEKVNLKEVQTMNGLQKIYVYEF